jgi:DNA-binding MarR family transcriptional regulator
MAGRRAQPKGKESSHVSAEEFRAAAELRATMRRFLRRSEQVTRAHGLTPERYELLLAIKALMLDDEAEGPTIGELAQALGLAPSSTTQLARRAEDNGLIERRVAGHDARVRYLRLTTEGERRLASAVRGLRPDRGELADASTRVG